MLKENIHAFGVYAEAQYHEQSSVLQHVEVQEIKDEWHVLRCIPIHFLKLAMMCNRLCTVARACAFA